MDNSMQPFAPQPSSRPLDPAQANSMPNNNSTPGTLDPQIPPAMPHMSQVNTQTASYADSMQGQFQPGQTAQLASGQGQPMLNNTGVSLESPILAPTHFDGMQNPNLQAQPIATPVVSTTSMLSPEQQKTKMFLTLSIIFGSLAFVGIVLGIWSLVSNISTSNKLKLAQEDLMFKNSIIQKIEEDTGKKITSLDNVPAYTAVTGNIYITEWGIKFKIPDDLENVSYTLDQKYRPQICFAAHKSGIKYFPAFADIDKNPRGVGCVTRVANYEGDSDKDNGMSFGQKIYSYGDYNYFYNAPEAHFSESAAEQGLEDTAAQIVKNMIANNIAHYE